MATHQSSIPSSRHLLKPLTFDQTSYLIDGQPVYLLSGEFHYFPRSQG